MIDPNNDFSKQPLSKTASKLAQRISVLQGHGWSVSENTLEKAYSFTNFKTINLFLEKLVAEILQQNHHPFFQFDPASKSCQLTLTTHDAGNKVSERDVVFAESLESFCKQLEIQNKKKR